MPADKPERTYAPIPLDTIKSMSGIDLMRAIRDCRLPSAPISQALDFHLDTVEPGFIVFVGRPNLSHYNPIGSVHGGYAGTLLDSCMSCAVQTVLQAGHGYTTLEYKVHLVRPIMVDTGPVRAEGRLIHSGRRTGTAEGRIIDEKGRVLAHGTTTCLIFPL
jgi:uncharacterized protein (TIGR00369 family)